LFDYIFFTPDKLKNQIFFKRARAERARGYRVPAAAAVEEFTLEFLKKKEPRAKATKLPATEVKKGASSLIA